MTSETNIAKKGDNIAKKSDSIGWDDGPTFLESLGTLNSRKPSEEKALIFPIQDVYKIEDKRIAVGRVEAGVIRAGQKIEVLPKHEVTTVKSIEKFLNGTDRAYAGESIGIMTEDSLFLNRGDVVCDSKDELVLTDSFQANIFWMSKEKFEKDEKIMIRCATQERTAKVEKINTRMNSSTLEILQRDADILNNLEVGQIVIKTKTPIVIESFDNIKELGRFVLVRDDNICAGGIITPDFPGNR